MNLPLVSSEWREMFDDSTVCMKKIQINIKDITPSNPSAPELRALLDSRRKYSSMKLDLKFRTNLGLKAATVTKFKDSLRELQVKINGNAIEQLHIEMEMPLLKPLTLKSNARAFFVTAAIKNSNLRPYFESQISIFPMKSSILIAIFNITPVERFRQLDFYSR